MKYKLKIYDDVRRFGLGYKERLERRHAVSSKFEIDLLEEAMFAKELEVLKKRQAASRRASRTSNTLGRSDFDETDVFVIDIDLFDSGYPFLTGETLSYLVRCFSKCGVIIGLSQYQKLDFDLTLKGQPESFTDFSISASQVDNPGLWGNEWQGFRPWHWPCIPLFVEAFEKKVKAIQDNPGAPIATSLGIEKIISSLPTSAIEYIGKGLSKTTFEEFVSESGKGLRGKDKVITAEIAARIAAARISKWLERMILPGQDILVDAPHLVSRFPSLFKGLKSKLVGWNATTKFLPHDRLRLDHEKIEKFRFKNDFWISRPVWFWSDISNYLGISEIKEPWERRENLYVFCEDASAFFPRAKCIEFVAGVESPFVRRFVKKFEGLVYSPNTNFLE